MGFSNGYDSGYADAVADMKRKGGGGSSGGGSSGATLNMAGIGVYQVVAPGATPMFDSAKIPVVESELTSTSDGNDTFSWVAPAGINASHFVIIEFPEHYVSIGDIGYDGYVEAGAYYVDGGYQSLTKVGKLSDVRA